MLRSVLGDEPRLGELNPQLSSFFEELVHALLAKDREARFPSAKSLLEVLKEAKNSLVGSRARALLAERRRSLRRIRIPRETALYGRRKELQVLDALFAEAASGEGRVLLEGEAGIGKTRLIDEFTARLGETPMALSF